MEWHRDILHCRHFQNRIVASFGTLLGHSQESCRNELRQVEQIAAPILQEGNHPEAGEETAIGE